MADLAFYKTLAIDFLRESGAIALEKQRTITRTIKDDKSIVTDIDMAISKMFAEKIAALPDAADHLLIDEEFTAPLDDAMRAKIAAAKYVWILDPVDGTLAYAHDMPFWGTFLALYIDGQPVIGGIHLPAIGDLMIAAPDGAGLSRNGGAFEPLGKIPPHDLGWNSIVFAANPQLYERTVKFFTLHAASVFAAYVVTGRAAAGIFGGRMKLWDVAAILPFCPHVGLEFFCSADGTALQTLDLSHFMADWTLAYPFILCQPANWPALLDLRTSPKRD